MKQYIWYHPSYILDTKAQIVSGQMENAKKHGYILLKEDELHQVKDNDHLTIVGHSTSPKSSINKDSDSDSDSDLEDVGTYIQGETAEQCIKRLQKSGLSKAPQILSLECCKAGLENGIATQLSSQSFFINTIIEANPSGIARTCGSFRCSMVPDNYGRVIKDAMSNPWVFLVAGQCVLQSGHGMYEIKEIVGIILGQKYIKSNTFFNLDKPKILDWTDLDEAEQSESNMAQGVYQS